MQPNISAGRRLLRPQRKLVGGWHNTQIVSETHCHWLDVRLSIYCKLILKRVYWINIAEGNSGSPERALTFQPKANKPETTVPVAFLREDQSWRNEGLSHEQLVKGIRGYLNHTQESFLRAQSQKPVADSASSQRPVGADPPSACSDTRRDQGRLFGS